MKALQLILCMLWLPVAVCAQVTMDINDEKLHGDVRSIEEYSYNYENERPYHTTIYTYDETRREVVAQMRDAWDSTGNNRCFFTYDDRKNIVLRGYYKGDKRDTTEWYTYNEDGALAGSMWVGKYQVSSRRLGKDTIIRKYDAAGHIAEETFIMGHSRHQDTYTYDTGRCMLSRLSGPRYRGRRFKTTYEYNAKGDVVEERRYDSPDPATKFKKASQVTRYTYKYDEHGNWTTRTYERDGRKQNYDVRVIRY